MAHAIAKSKFYMVMQVVSTVLFATIMAALAVFIVVQMLPPKVGVDMFGFKTFLISDTKSMEPNLYHNDMIVVVKADFDSLDVGDTITFMGQVQQNNAIKTVPITHQIVEVVIDRETGARSYRTQGTNQQTNPRADVRLVTEHGTNGTNLFIGKYAFKMSLLGQLIAYMQSAYGIFALVVCLMVVLLLYWIALQNPQPQRLQTLCTHHRN